VTVRLYNSANVLQGTTTTNASGVYSFTNLVPGDYYVEFVKPAGYVFSPQDQGANDAVDSDANTSTGKTAVTTLISGESDLTWDAGLYQYATLGDKVWSDTNANGIQDGGEAGLSGVTVKLYNSANVLQGTTTTNASGVYSFTNLTPGDYYVQFTLLTGYYFSPKDQGANDAVDSDADTSTGKTAVTTLISGESDLTWDAGMYYHASLGDFVWNDTDADKVQDPGELGIPGVVISLTLPSGVVLTTTTDANGLYLFDNLPAGNFVVDVVSVPSGYFLTTANDPLPVTLAPSQNYRDADFGYAGKGHIVGVVFYDWDKDGVQDVNETGIDNVEVCLYQDVDGDGVFDNPGDVQLACQNTTSGGGYAFNNYMPGDYLVVQTQPPDLQSSPASPNVRPVHLVVVGPGGQSEQRDFGELYEVRVGDQVFVDANGNGIQDPGEPGMIGVPLQLTGIDAAGTAISQSVNSLNGAYIFDTLLPGTYTVTAPANFNNYLRISASPLITTFVIGSAAREDLTLDFRYAYPTGLSLQRFDAAVQGGKVVLSWEIIGAAPQGFNVWRADNAKAAGAVKLTATPLLSADSVYQFVDKTVTAGQSYWYWLENVSDGQRFGPQSVAVPAGPTMRVRAFLPMVSGSVNGR
jgi:protocatechuate 3,4-dioxygenase beta subunit